MQEKFARPAIIGTGQVVIQSNHPVVSVGFLWNTIDGELFIDYENAHVRTGKNAFLQRGYRKISRGNCPFSSRLHVEQADPPFLVQFAAQAQAGLHRIGEADAAGEKRAKAVSAETGKEVLVFQGLFFYSFNLWS